jgi:hypothetical protein
MRAVQEADRLLVPVTDPHEERIPRRWLADMEVKQAEATPPSNGTRSDSRGEARSRRRADQERRGPIYPFAYTTYPGVQIHEVQIDGD